MENCCTSWNSKILLDLWHQIFFGDNPWQFCNCCIYFEYHTLLVIVRKTNWYATKVDGKGKFNGNVESVYGYFIVYGYKVSTKYQDLLTYEGFIIVMTFQIL